MLGNTLHRLVETSARDRIHGIGNFHAQLRIPSYPDATLVVQAPLSSVYNRHELDAMEKIGVITRVSVPTDRVLRYRENSVGRLRFFLDSSYLHRTIKVANALFKLVAHRGYGSVLLDQGSCMKNTFDVICCQHKFLGLTTAINLSLCVTQERTDKSIANAASVLAGYPLRGNHQYV